MGVFVSTSRSESDSKQISEGSDANENDFFDMKKQKRIENMKKLLHLPIDYNKVKLHPFIVEKLFDDFVIGSDSNSEFDEHKFKKKYPEISNTTIYNFLLPLLIKSEEKRKITFINYLHLISIAFSGTYEEKSTLICKVFNQNFEGKEHMIHQGVVEEFVKGMADILSLPKEKRKSNLESVNTLFMKQKNPEGGKFVSIDHDIVMDEEKFNSVISSTNDFKDDSEMDNDVIQNVTSENDSESDDESNSIESLKEKSMIFQKNLVESRSNFEKNIDNLLEKKDIINMKLDKAYFYLKQKIDETIQLDDRFISEEDLILNGKSNSDWIDCFGLFGFISKPILKIENSLIELGINNLKENFKRPTFRGFLTSDKSKNSRYTKVEDGFISFYQGDEMSKDPSKVFNLQEAIVDRIPTLENFEKYSFRLSFKNEKYTRTFFVDTEEELEKWIWSIRGNTGYRRYQNQSSFQIQENCGAKFYISGKDYFSDLANYLKNAEEEILISGWAIHPHFFLNRNPFKDKLDDILLERAKNGVKIRILLWDEAVLIIDLGSSYAKEYLNSLHKNITVVRDPEHYSLIHWSHHQKTVIIDQNIAFVGGLDIAYNRWDDENYSLFDHENKFIPGMDYVNPMISSGKSVGDNLKSFLKRDRDPRMPWRDIHTMVSGLSARDVARNFAQRWNFSRRNEKSVRPMELFSQQKEIKYTLPYTKCKIQVLRSASKWSFATEIPEKSIYEASIKLIQKAQHYIYIENQFFISSSGIKQKNPQNKILAAIITKIKWAIEYKKSFKLIVLLPIQPSRDASEGAARIMIYWTHNTIYRGDNSLFSILESEFPDVDISNYIAFYSLRNYGFPKNCEYPVTEMVYIHRSANLNDRSLHGGRDSEIAVLIEDEEKIETMMNKTKYSASKYVHELRKQCWGDSIKNVESKELIDPITCFDFLKNIAKKNTLIYEKVFIKVHSTIYHDSDLKYLNNYHNNFSKETLKNIEMLKDIQGYLVTYPREFLHQSDKNTHFTQKIDMLFI
eukprot:gene9934-2255_t